MKRILTALLVLLLLVSAVACSAEKEIPDGYFSVSLSDEIFDLYVPGTWQNNSSSSISSAIYSQGSAVYVSAYSQMAETTKIVLADYVDAMIESYEEQFSDFEVTSEVKDTTLDSFAAQTFDYKMKVNDKTMLLRNIVAKNENMFTTLTYCAPEADFETHLADFESMVLYFTFREFEVETFVLEDEHTPDGFLMASGDKYEFRFFVPDTWKVDMYSAIPRAYYSDIELSNVSLTSFAVTDTIKTGKDYWNSFKTIYERDYVLSVISDRKSVV